MYLVTVHKDVEPKLGHVRQGNILVPVQDLKGLTDEAAIAKDAGRMEDVVGRLILRTVSGAGLVSRPRAEGALQLDGDLGGRPQMAPHLVDPAMHTTNERHVGMSLSFCFFFFFKLVKEGGNLPSTALLPCGGGDDEDSYAGANQSITLGKLQAGSNIHHITAPPPQGGMICWWAL